MSRSPLCSIASLLAAGAFGALLAAGCADVDCGPPIDGPVPAASFAQSPLAAPNLAPLARYVAEHSKEPLRSLWLAVVPGTSEEWGHHKAPPLDEDPDGTLISPEFEARLDMAFRFLKADVVRFVLVSGGAVDPARPDYVEAERGRGYLLSTYSGEWAGDGPLEERVFVDPLAERSTTNLRNADKLSVDLGLSKNLIVTTMPAYSGFAPAGYAAQGFYFLEHEISTFDLRCHNDLGYQLGAFSLYTARAQDGDYLEGILHCSFPVKDLRQDEYGP